MAITAERLRVEVEADTDQAERGLDRMEDRGRRIPGWAKVAGAAVATFATTAVVGFGKMALNAASDLNETIQKTGEVFGPVTDEVTGFADAMAREFGLGKTVVLDAASSFGLLANAAGLGADASADMSMSLAALAADAASFYNVPLEEALQKIRSGLVGEAEPMRAFGVLLSEAAVQAKALELGLWDGTGAMTEAMKVQARAALITEGLATAQGDLARTSESVANQTRELGGRFQNLAADIGQAFLPAAGWVLSWANDAMAWLGERVPGAIEAMRERFSGVGDAIGGIVGPIGDAFAPILPALSGLIQPVLGIVQAFSPLGLVLRALQPILPQIAGALAQVAGILAGALGNALRQVLPAVTRVAETVGGALAEAFETIIPPILDLLPMIADLVGTLVGALMPVLNALLPILGQVASVIVGMFAQAIQALLPIIQALLPVIGEVAGVVANVLLVAVQALSPLITMLGEVFTALQPVLVTLLDPLLQIHQAFMPIVTLVGELVASLLPPVIELFTALLQPILDLIPPLVEDLRPILDLIAQVISGAVVPVLTTLIRWLANLVEAIIPVVQWLAERLVGAITTLIGWLGNLAGSIASFVSDAIAKIRQWAEGFSEKFQEVMDWFGGLPGMIRDAFANAGRWLIDAGRNIITGLWDGLREKWQGVQDWFGGIGTWIQEHKGPREYDLRLLVPNGGWIMEGFQRGLAKGMDETRRSIREFTRDLSVDATASVAYRPTVAGRVTAQSLGVSAQVMGPTHITVVDADGALIGTMRVQAGKVLTGAVTPLDEGMVAWA